MILLLLVFWYCLLYSWGCTPSLACGTVHLHHCLSCLHRQISRQTEPLQTPLKGIFVFWREEIEYCFYPSCCTALYSSLCTARSPPNSSVQRMRLDHWTSQSPADCWPTSTSSSSTLATCWRPAGWTSDNTNKHHLDIYTNNINVRLVRILDDSDLRKGILYMCLLC